MKKLKVNNYYHTADLNLSVVLSMSYPLWSINKSNPQKAEFIFERKEGLDNLIEKFWRREVRVEPIAFFSQLKVIKSRLYEDK